MKVSREELWCT